MSTNNTPRIYVASLAAYNSGYLHGEWIDATQDVKLIEKEIQEILDSSPVWGEEWAIHDYDEFGYAGNFLGEYPQLEDVVKVAKFIGEAGVDIASKLINYYGDIDTTIRIFEENYTGCYKSLRDFAQEVSLDSSKEIPKWLEDYINWERMGKDWELNGEILTIETGFEELHVFWNS